MLRLIALALFAAVLCAQTAAQPTSQPSFEVASVKPVVGVVPNHPVGLLIHHGTLNIDDAQLRQIVGLAFEIQRVRVQGGPAWLDMDKYNIIAKAESADASPDDIKAMLRTLLAERFKLAVHRETKDLPVYTMAVGKNGPKLQEATEEQKSSSSVRGTSRGFQMAYQKTAMPLLINTLANMLGSPVLDKTELTGRYNFTLEWADERFRPANRPDAPEVETFPDLFTALPDQLGLKLEVKKGPVEVLVVDHAEKATEN